VGGALPRLVEDAREVLGQPARDLRVVALLGPDVRLLAASVEAALEELADVLGVEGDAEVAADDLGDARGGP
jgi:hypothetical protein